MAKRSLLIAAVIVIASTTTTTSEASSARCVSWRASGGSSVCTTWKTGSVIFSAVLKQNCPPGGCSVGASANTSNAVAFCQDPSGPPRKVTSTEDVTFAGFGQFTEAGKGKWVFTQEFDAPAGAGQAACDNAGFGVVLGLTPITMDTSESFFGSGGPSATGSPSSPKCPDGSSSCTITEHCSISPGRINYQESNAYQCAVTSAGP